MYVYAWYHIYVHVCVYTHLNIHTYIYVYVLNVLWDERWYTEMCWAIAQRCLVMAYQYRQLDVDKLGA